ncbi:MAG: hypothetical protein AB7S26_33425 [Sandaracinaceae bacterium]
MSGRAAAQAEDPDGGADDTTSYEPAGEVNGNAPDGAASENAASGDAAFDDSASIDEAPAPAPVDVIVEAPRRRTSPLGERAVAIDRRGRGRGFQYGAHVVLPIYATDVRRAEGGLSAPVFNPGIGIRIHLGWELPEGFALLAYAGFAFNYVDYGCPAGMPDCARSMLRDNVQRIAAGAELRYSVFTDTPLTPFFGVGGGLSIFWVEWEDGLGELAAAPTVGLHAAVGSQLELAPFADLELGAYVEYAFTMDGSFHEPGILVVTPFLGVSLYIDDPDDPTF